MNARSKFLVGSGIIIVTLLALAYVGFTQSKTYYHTITELSTLQGSSLHQRMRVSGNVQAGSIEHVAGRVEFRAHRAGQESASELHRPRSFAGHVQGWSAGAGRRQDCSRTIASRRKQSRPNARRNTKRRRSELRQRLPSRRRPRRAVPHGLPEASASQVLERISAGEIFGYLGFFRTAAGFLGGGVCGRSGNRRDSDPATFCSQRVPATPAWQSSFW